MARLTRGIIESQLANALVQFQREQHGRGPADVRVSLLGDLIIVRYGGILTATESHLASTDEGRRLIKSARQELRTIIRSDLESLVATMTGCAVKRSFCDVNVEAAEQMEVFVLDADLEKRLLRQDLDALNDNGTRPPEDRSR